MNIVLWILQILLAVGFGMAGLMKLAQSKEKLVASGMAWAGSVAAGGVKAIGALELLAAIGLILPAATGIVPILTPLAALGLVLVMIGAAVTHARRKENQMLVVNLLLLVAAAVVAWGRFGPYSF